MRHPCLKHACSLSLMFSLLLASPSLWAQWAWRDTNGTVQYSDTPPPSSVPQHRIVKQPDVSPGATAPVETQTATKPSESEADAPTWVEQNAEFVKRREQRLEQEKKAKEESQAAAEKSKYCAQLHENLRLLESGRPVRQTTASGAMQIMSEGERASQIKQMREHLNECS